MKKTSKLYTIAVIMTLTLSLTQVKAQSPSASTVKNSGGETSDSNVKLNSGFPTITGSGTPGRIPKFTAGTVIRDSIITQSKSNNIGIDTTTPTSKLTVAGMIETTLDGVKFPDGTVQTTAAISSPALASPAQTAFQREFILNLAPNQIEATDQIQVPAGKRMVIEYISIVAFIC